MDLILIWGGCQVNRCLDVDRFSHFPNDAIAIFFVKFSSPIQPEWRVDRVHINQLSKAQRCEFERMLFSDS